LYYDDFLNYLSSSDHFQIVQLKDFKNAHSSDKVIIALRYDIDENINAAVKLAYREHKYGIKSTYFVLHTGTYYGEKVGDTFKRNDNIIYYLKKIQDDFGHEIGFHNDLVTLQVVYGIEPKEYLRNELAFLRGNNINVVGTTYHGSQYCYIYHYYNAYFWKEYPDNGWNYEYVTKGYKTIKIEKDSLQNYNFQYEGGLLDQDYFFADCNFINGKRWNMSMVNLDTIKPGKKVIILLHPANWD
jgi:predicted lactoylglutathione lyase